MKTKTLLILAMLAAFLLVAGSGAALASGKYRGDRYGYNRHPVVVYHVQPRVVYKYHSPANLCLSLPRHASITRWSQASSS